MVVGRRTELHFGTYYLHTLFLHDMTATAPTRSHLPLRGSARLVVEFFDYAINTILYQRGIYPSDDFEHVRKYDLNMLVTSDPEVKAYIKKIMSQLHDWLLKGKISKLILAITSKDSGEAVERWQFDVEILSPAQNHDPAQTEASKQIISQEATKSKEEIQKEIQAIVRQITASVTFLPVLSEPCTFNVLVYGEGDINVPSEWADSDPRLIQNAELVSLRSFTTDKHKIQTSVAYQLGK